MVIFSVEGPGVGDATETEDGVALSLTGTTEAPRLTASSGPRWSLSEFAGGEGVRPGSAPARAWPAKFVAHWYR